MVVDLHIFHHLGSKHMPTSITYIYFFHFDFLANPSIISENLIVISFISISFYVNTRRIKVFKHKMYCCNFKTLSHVGHYVLLVNYVGFTLTSQQHILE